MRGRANILMMTQLVHGPQCESHVALLYWPQGYKVDLGSIWCVLFLLPLSLSLKALRVFISATVRFNRDIPCLGLFHFAEHSVDASTHKCIKFSYFISCIILSLSILFLPF